MRGWGWAAAFALALATAPVGSTATTALVMGGSGHPLSTPSDTVGFVQDYLAAAINDFVSPAANYPTGIPSGPYNAVAVITPADGSPDSGTRGLAALHACITSTTCDYNPSVGSSAPAPSDVFVVYGYSQSAGIAMDEKRNLAATYLPGGGPNVSFVVTGNSRPNGGVVGRDVDGIVVKTLFGADRAGYVPPPTDTQYQTVDIARQYDGLADNPLNPLNLLAELNAYVGLYLHVTYGAVALTDSAVIDQGQYGDTHYYLISTPILPLLAPLEPFGPLGHALADTLDAPLRVIIESSYDRTVSPGVPTPWDHSYFPDPAAFARNLLLSIPTGLDNGVEDMTGARPFGTTRPGPYGVGGPSVTYLAQETPAPAAATRSTTKKTPATGHARAKATAAQKNSRDASPRPRTGVASGQRQHR